MMTLSLTSEQIANMLVTSYNFSREKDHLEFCGAMRTMCYTALGDEEGEAFYIEASNLAKQMIKK